MQQQAGEVRMDNGNAAGHTVEEVKQALKSARNSYGKGASNINPIKQNRTYLTIKQVLWRSKYCYITIWF